jgi:hypothetical protein
MMAPWLEPKATTPAPREPPGREDETLKIENPERVCVVVPAAHVEGAKAVAAQRETTFSIEVRRAIRAHVEAETRRLGMREQAAA